MNLTNNEQIKITRWNNNQTINVEEISACLEKEGLSPFLWHDEVGTYYPTHSHPYTEVRWLVSGSITFGIENQEITLYAGDRLDLLPHTLHYARMSEQSPTIYICASKK